MLTRQQVIMSTREMPRYVQENPSKLLPNRLHTGIKKNCLQYISGTQLQLYIAFIVFSGRKFTADVSGVLDNFWLFVVVITIAN